MMNTPLIKVLLVDDEEMVLSAMEVVLKRAGYNVIACKSAQEALKTIETHTFDVILSDLLMPDIDGVAFIETLRTKGVETPVIALTGGIRIGQQNLSEEAVNAGAMLSLRKPVNRSQVDEAIASALSR